MRAFLLSALGGLALSFTAHAEAATLRVPSQFANIQAAVDAAAAGDRIIVSRGSYCGATLTKPVSLEGRGRPTIIGCSTSPQITTGLRAGFYLPGSQGTNPASGSHIRGFVFDGEGVSNANLAPLSFGVFARFASDVVVEGNRFHGTVQAITATAADRWIIRNNRITDLTLLDCTGHCTGGDGIVLGLGRGSLAAPGGTGVALNRSEDNVIADNVIQGSAPDGFSAFSMVGILLLSADHTTVLANRLRLTDNPNASAQGQGILVSNTCCGLGVSFLPGSRFTTVAFNDAHRSEVGLVVEGSGGANTLGLFLDHNSGTAQIEGAAIVALAARSAAAPARAQPTL